MTRFATPHRSRCNLPAVTGLEVNGSLPTERFVGGHPDPTQAEAPEISDPFARTAADVAARPRLPTCLVPGCCRPAVALGVCREHLGQYARAAARLPVADRPAFRRFCADRGLLATGRGGVRT